MTIGIAEIERVQAYLRASARQRYETQAVPPFTAYYHPIDTFQYFNYAIPDGPIEGDVQDELFILTVDFLERGRVPRFEFIEECAPNLAAELHKARYLEEGRQPLMLCTPATFTPAPDVPGLTITRLTVDSAIADAIGFITVQRQGFDTTYTDRASATEAQQFLGGLGNIVSFLARLDDEPVGAGAFTQPLDRITEIVGVATVAPFRRRGIAAALTAAAVQTAYVQGATLACLTAADLAAGHVYERVGFRTAATMLSYYLPTELA